MTASKWSDPLLMNISEVTGGLQIVSCVFRIGTCYKMNETNPTPSGFSPECLLNQ